MDYPNSIDLKANAKATCAIIETPMLASGEGFELVVSNERSESVI